MSKKKKRKRHQVRAVNPGTPPDVTSTPQTSYTPKEPTSNPQTSYISKEPTTKALKTRLLR